MKYAEYSRHAVQNSYWHAAATAYGSVGMLVVIFQNVTSKQAKKKKYLKEISEYHLRCVPVGYGTCTRRVHVHPSLIKLGAART